MEYAYEGQTIEKRDGIVEELGRHVQDVMEVAHMLRNRLAPVMRPESPTMVEQDSPVGSAMRNELATLRGVTATLREVLDRLEV